MHFKVIDKDKPRVKFLEALQSVEGYYFETRELCAAKIKEKFNYESGNAIVVTIEPKCAVGCKESSDATVPLDVSRFCVEICPSNRYAYVTNVVGSNTDKLVFEYNSVNYVIIFRKEKWSNGFTIISATEDGLSVEFIEVLCSVIQGVPLFDKQWRRLKSTFEYLGEISPECVFDYAKRYNIKLTKCDIQRLPTETQLVVAGWDGLYNPLSLTALGISRILVSGNIR